MRMFRYRQWLRHKREVYYRERWDKNAVKGARVQLPLSASTGIEITAYLYTMYIGNLIGLGSVNTAPSETLNAFLEQGTVDKTIACSTGESRIGLEKLKEACIDLNGITQQLPNESTA